MGKLTGFMDFDRNAGKYREPAARTKDWDEFHELPSDEELKIQAARCMNCGTPFCQTGKEINHLTTGCPVFNLIPDWNDLIYKNHWKKAYDLLNATNNFPEFTGKACPAPCEGSCVLAINEPAVTIKNIEMAIIDRAFQEGWVKPKFPKISTQKNIAIIGSGPAGLACAEQLNSAGHTVTVFERDNRIGGLLMYGIPNMKLNKKTVDRRVEILKEAGVEFLINQEIGKNIEFNDLKNNYHAVVICTGAQKHRNVDLPGRDLKGIHYAMDYLTPSIQHILPPLKTNRPLISAKDKNVIVLGGGDTGTDCIGTALRQGCKSIVQFQIHKKPSEQRSDQNPWPLWPMVYTLEYGQTESKALFGQDPRTYKILTEKFVGDKNGNLKEIHTIEVNTKKDKERKTIVEKIPGSEKIWPAELALISIGFEGPEQGFIQKAALDTDKRSNIKANTIDYKTNIEGVFTAGDSRRGQSLIVWAIQEGRRAAYACDQYLMGSSSLPL